MSIIIIVCVAVFLVIVGIVWAMNAANSREKSKRARAVLDEARDHTDPRVVGRGEGLN